MTITGTGFVTGTTVNFVEESQGIPASDNVVLAATGVTVNGPSSITATAPAVTEGFTYYVTVATPIGNSAYATNDVFTYSPAAPTITGINPSSGSVAGGNAVTITGTGFVSGAIVSFVQESNGTPVTGGVTVGAGSVSVTGSTSITAVSPAVTATGTYFVTVTTSTGTAATSSNDVYTYSLLVPLVSSVSPATGRIAGGTLVTIGGIGFVSGDTVSFTQESGYSATGSAIAATGVTVVGSTTITAMSPAVTSTGTYFVTVTSSAGTSSYYPIFTYSS
ncbi:MAG: IPT/TIG domain-containing protein [Acidimicrobiales bacterium]